MRCARAWRVRRAVSMLARSPSTRKLFGAWCAEALVPPTSDWSGSSSSTGAMWYVGCAAVVSSALAMLLSGDVVVDAGVSGAAAAWAVGSEELEPPPQAVRQARRTTERARAGLAFWARAKRFKADPSLMSCGHRGQWLARRSRMPRGMGGTARHDTGAPGMDKQPGPRRDQLPGAVEAGRACRPALRFRAASASCSNRREDRTQLDGLPNCNGRRILPKYLLDHSGRCNNLQLDNSGEVLTILLRHCRAKMHRSGPFSWAQ